MVGSAIGAVGALGAAEITSSGASNGASNATKITQASTDAAKQDVVNGQTEALGTLAPYTTAGSQATNALADDLGISGNTGATGYGTLATPFTSADLPTSDGYNFQLQQGMKALQRTQAANGTLNSGAAAKALNDYTQDAASTEYQNAFNNYNTNQSNLYSRLSGLGTTGANAANTAVGVEQSTANNIANLTTGQGLQAASNYAAGNTASTYGLATGLNSLNTPSNVSNLNNLGNTISGYLSGLGTTGNGLNQLVGPYSNPAGSTGLSQLVGDDN